MVSMLDNFKAIDVPKRAHRGVPGAGRGTA